MVKHIKEQFKEKTDNLYIKLNKLINPINLKIGIEEKSLHCDSDSDIGLAVLSDTDTDDLISSIGETIREKLYSNTTEFYKYYTRLRENETL